MENHAVGQNALVGQTLGHYRVSEKIGAGGMGEVFRAHDQHLNRDVAIKVLPPGILGDESVRKRFHKEALALSKLNHPNIATIHDFDAQRGVDFLVMEYIPGTTLSEKLGGRPLPEKEVVSLGAQLADGLSAAHEQGVVHRDIKPGNLRLTADGRLKILDFGLARLRLPATPTAPTESLSETHALAGTLPYMAPEQLLGGEIDARTDIHAVGAVLYEMATGQQPFAQVERSQLIGAILHRPPRPPTTLNTRSSPELERIIGKCLEKEPENRYQSAKELAIDLRRMLTPSTAKVSAVPVAGRKAWKVLVPAALILVAAAIGARLYFGSQRAHGLKERDTIVLADFVNSTGEPVFDDTLTQGLAIQLEQSSFLNVLSDERVNSTLKLMKRTPGERITREMAREICLRTGGQALVAGSLAKLGNSYAIILRTANCQTGDSLASVEADADSREHVLQTLGEAVTKLRGRLGESLASIQKFDKPLEEATTSSLEALQAFTASRRLDSEQGSVAALPYAKRAVELDPAFASAHSLLVRLYKNVGEDSSSMEHAKRAYELRDRVSERERLSIEAAYFDGTGEADKQIQVYTQWIQAYPFDPDPHRGLGWVYGERQEFEKAIAETREVQRLMPENSFGYSNLMYLYIQAGRLDEAKKTFEEAQARKLANPYLYVWAYHLAFFQDDAAQMQQYLAWSQGRPAVEGWFLASHAGVEAYHGHCRSSRQLSQQAADSASRSDRNRDAADCCLGGALIAAWTGNSGQAREFASKGLRLAAVPEMALPLALVGDRVEAQKWIAAGKKSYPSHHNYRRQNATVAEAVLDLQGGKAKDALARLEGLPAPPVPFDAWVSAVRAQALLRLGQGEAAAQEYSNILAHRYLVLFSENAKDGVLVPLSYLGLGRARSLAGDRAGARQAYEQFFDIWKDADPDIPILKAAKTEYAKLQ